MRSYTATLLFEEVLDLVTPGSLKETLIEALLLPSVSIVEEDCETFLGVRALLSPDLIGKMDRGTGTFLSRLDLINHSNAGETELSLRSSYSCVSSGGICQKCFEASYPKRALPAVGTSVTLKGAYFLQVEHGVLDADKSFPLSLPFTLYDTLYVYVNGGLQSPANYAVSNTAVACPPRSPGDNITVKYEVQNKVPFMQYLSGTYGGALLGMRGLVSRPMPLSVKLHSELIPEEDMQALISLVQSMNSVPNEIKLYLKTCKNRLEKAILASAAAAIFP